MITLPRVRYEIITEPCAWCECFPCLCELEAPCACGGTVVVREDGIVYAVQLHQATEQHAAWRVANEL